MNHRSAGRLSGGVAKKLKDKGLRATIDLRYEKIALKIHEYSTLKILAALQYQLGGNVDLGAMPVDEFVAKITADIASKA